MRPCSVMWLFLLVLGLGTVWSQLNGAPRRYGNTKPGQPPSWWKPPSVDNIAFECPAWHPCPCPDGAKDVALGKRPLSSGNVKGAGAEVVEPVPDVEPEPWWKVDLGGYHDVCRVLVTWDYAHATGYEVCVEQWCAGETGQCCVGKVGTHGGLCRSCEGRRMDCPGRCVCGTLP